MSLSATSSEGAGTPPPGRWLPSGRSPIVLICLSAVCGIGLAAAGMMLMRAFEGAGVKDVVAELSRPAAARAMVAPSSATADLAAPPRAASSSDASSPADPTQTSAIPRPVASASPEPTSAAAQPAKTGETSPTKSADVPAAAGRIVKRSALDPIKPLRARKDAAGVPSPEKLRADAAHPTTSEQVPAGLRAIAAPAGSAANVRAYSVAGAAAPASSAQGGSGGVRIVRIEVPTSR